MVYYQLKDESLARNGMSSTLTIEQYHRIAESLKKYYKKVKSEEDEFFVDQRD